MKRLLLTLAIPLLGCGTQLSSARVTIVFENESATKCVKVSARRAGGATVNGVPAAINRGAADELVVGVGQTAELTGEVQVTVSRFAQVDCPGAAFASETRSVTLTRGVAMLEFRYVGFTDGGVDAGVDGGGSDGGCDTSMCPGPGECERGPVGCGCSYGRAPVNTPCSVGVCDSTGQCSANVCATAPTNTPCDAGLTCLANTTCQANFCTGTCLNAGLLGVCERLDDRDCDTPTTCRRVPNLGLNGSSCAAGLCLDGLCRGWVNFPNIVNLHTAITDLPYPDAGWVLASPDGGRCDTIISTSGAAPSILQGECGSPPLVARVDDAGVSVMAMLGLTVDTNAALHFVGDRPAQLIVLGDATVRGMISVAPFTPFPPAGSQPPGCVLAGDGVASAQGGGGGGFGDEGGDGGNNGGRGGQPSGSLSPLRGGCAGGSGFRASGQSDGGRGGGALELIVSGNFTIPGGLVTASGEGGAGGRLDHEGGGGGGSGGTLIIEARNAIDLAGGAITANGGGGGEGGDNPNPGGDGPFGSIDSGTRLATASNGGGGNGGRGGAGMFPRGEEGTTVGGNNGGGGGGASVGRILLNGRGSCTRGTGVFSPGGAFTCN